MVIIDSGGVKRVHQTISMNPLFPLWDFCNIEWNWVQPGWGNVLHWVKTECFDTWYPPVFPPSASKGMDLVWFLPSVVPGFRRCVCKHHEICFCLQRAMRKSESWKPHAHYLFFVFQSDRNSEHWRILTLAATIATNIHADACWNEKCYIFSIIFEKCKWILKSLSKF